MTSPLPQWLMKAYESLPLLRSRCKCQGINTEQVLVQQVQRSAAQHVRKLGSNIYFRSHPSGDTTRTTSYSPTNCFFQVSEESPHCENEASPHFVGSRSLAHNNYLTIQDGVRVRHLRGGWLVIYTGNSQIPNVSIFLSF